MIGIENATEKLEGLTVLVRTNFDVPLDNGQTGDTTRIEDAIPTIKYLRQNHAQLILMAHAGRPDGIYREELSFRPVTAVLEKLLSEPVSLVSYQSDYQKLQFSTAPINLIENLRFWGEEEENDPGFGSYLAGLGQVFVNEAFANCHRKHASMVGIPKILTGHSYAGISLAKEIAVLNQVKEQPERPFIVVIGGAKLETKAPLVSALAPIADWVMVGGKIAADLKGQTGLPANILLAQLNLDGKDITEDSAQEFARRILTAKTVMWNGTMGIFEDPDHQLGTQLIARAVNQTAAFTLVGGGDTESALTKLKLESGIDFISSGGGAMLAYLSEGHLPALDALG
jgi:phosphoglycerate kinase